MKSNCRDVLIDVYVLLCIIGLWNGIDKITKVVSSCWNIGVSSSQSIVCFLLLLISLFIFKADIKKAISQCKQIDINEIISAWCIVGILGVIIFLLFNITNTYSIGKPSQSNIFLILFQGICFSPIFEELFFRCGITYILKKQFRMSDVSVIIMVAVIFSLLHLWKIENVPWNVVVGYFIFYCLMGISSGILYKKHDNVIYPISFHAIWNSSTLIRLIII